MFAEYSQFLCALVTVLLFNSHSVVADNETSATTSEPWVSSYFEKNLKCLNLCSQ